MTPDLDPNYLTHEQLAGQRLLAGFDGTELNRDLKLLIGTLKVAGIILFARNIRSPQQVRRLCQDVQEYAASCGQPPLLIAVDQEGGQVARLKPPFFTQFPGNPEMRDETDAVSFARVTAEELHGIGVNMNMAPVMDVTDPRIDSVMRKRAFGSDPKRVARLGGIVIDGLQGRGIMAVAKHYPGIGRTTLDSHLDQPHLKAGTDEMERVDLPPFAAAIEHDVAGIMLSHILYQDMDPDWPASLSPRIALKRLRNHMGYDGIVMTDDLDMGAIKGRYGIEIIMRQISGADIDLALICHKGPDIRKAFDGLQEIIVTSMEGKASAQRSAERVIRTKRRYLSGK